jgi:hypothetical protein
MKYFAYGSNMDQTQMTERGIDFTSRVHATLKGYKLVLTKKHLQVNILSLIL